MEGDPVHYMRVKDMQRSYELRSIIVNADKKAEEAKLWRPLAEQGHADAQYNLGYMTRNGLGDLRDNILAYMWTNLAAER